MNVLLCKYEPFINFSFFTCCRTKLFRAIVTHIILHAEAENRVVRLEELDTWGGYISSAPEVRGHPFFQRDAVFSWYYKPRRGASVPRQQDSSRFEILTSREAKVSPSAKFPSASLIVA